MKSQLNGMAFIQDFGSYGAQPEWICTYFSGQRLSWTVMKIRRINNRSDSDLKARLRRLPGAKKVIFLYERAPVLLKSIVSSGSDKVFCISMQRTGTTSVGKFFRDFGYRWAGWKADEKNGWSEAWYEGDYERIFSSFDFRAANAYEDAPWWLPNFYKVLFYRFPKAKFVLFTRDSDAWFQSLLNHSGGNIIGNSRIHCKVYRRERDYYELLNSGEFDEELENQNYSEKTLKLNGYDEHYKNIYEIHNNDVQDFFRRHSPNSLFVGRLEDPLKWQQLGNFLGIHVPSQYRSHENKSNSS